MHHMVFLNPRGIRRHKARRRFHHLPRRGTGGRFVRSSRSTVNSTHKTTMARKVRRRRSLRRRRLVRVRRNPPAMTPARRKAIGRKIRALHRAGKYRKSSVRRMARRASSAISRVARRVSRRRSSGGYRSAVAVGGGMLGLRAIFNAENLKFVGGAIGGTFVANFAAAKIVPMLPASVQGNPFVVAAVKLGASAVTAKVVSRWSRPVAQGVLIGGMIVVANDFIRMYFAGGSTAGSSAQYLGRNMSQYLGGPRVPAVNRNITSLVGPVSPTAPTFASARRSGALYGNTSAFPSDAWAR